MNRQARHGCLRNEVYQALREGILNGKYKRGEMLRELALSKALGVSRTPVREAFCQLQLDGLVKVTPNKSVVVRGFDEKDIYDLYEIRYQVEALAAARAADNMTDDLRGQLKQTYEEEQHITAKDDFKKLQDLDSEFHRLIFQGSGSNILQNLLSSLSVFTRKARLTSLSNPGRSQQVLQEHYKIMTAILEKNSEAARLTMQEHIANAAANFKVVSQKGR